MAATPIGLASTKMVVSLSMSKYARVGEPASASLSLSSAFECSEVHVHGADL